MPPNRWHLWEIDLRFALNSRVKICPQPGWGNGPQHTSGRSRAELRPRTRAASSRPAAPPAHHCRSECAVRERERKGSREREGERKREREKERERERERERATLTRSRISLETRRSETTRSARSSAFQAATCARERARESQDEVSAFQAATTCAVSYERGTPVSSTSRAPRTDLLSRMSQVLSFTLSSHRHHAHAEQET